MERVAGQNGAVRQVAKVVLSFLVIGTALGVGGILTWGPCGPALPLLLSPGLQIENDLQEHANDLFSTEASLLLILGVQGIFWSLTGLVVGFLRAACTLSVRRD